MNTNANDDIVLPTIHLNGSDRTVLFEGYLRLMVSLVKAKDDLCIAGFHARDYYVQGDEALKKANDQRDAMFSHINSLIDYTEKHLEHLA